MGSAASSPKRSYTISPQPGDVPINPAQHALPASAASSPRRSLSPPPVHSPRPARHPHALHAHPVPSAGVPVPPSPLTNNFHNNHLHPTDPSPSPAASSSASRRPPDPRRKKSLELPDLASLALTPVSARPLPQPTITPVTPVTPRTSQQPPPPELVAYAYPPGAGNVPSSPVGTPPVSRRPTRGRAASDSARPATVRRPSAPPQQPPPPQKLAPTALDSGPPSPRTDVVFSALPSGLPERIPGLSLDDSADVQPPTPVTGAIDESATEAGSSTTTTKFKWEGGGTRVIIAGSFLDEWKGREMMDFDSTSSVHTFTYALPPGTHRFKFIIDGDWRCSQSYETATDPLGNLINTIHIPDPTPASPLPGSAAPVPSHTPSPTPLVVQTSPTPNSESGPSAPPPNPNPATHTLRPSGSAESALGGRWDSNPRSDITSDASSPLWTSVPPAVLTSLASNPRAAASLAPPPALPRHLERVILNAADRPGGQADGEDNSVLPLPNHVVLNHLTASAIRGGVMAVGITGRYGHKLVTTIYYRPVGL